MGLKTHELDALKEYLPDNTLEDVIYFMQSYKIHLILRKDRKSILGDYRPPHQGKPHTISLNISLNKYHFLITFIHEVAHLINFLNHKRSVMPHGTEWKEVYAMLLKRFMDKDVFPEDIHHAIKTSIKSLSASTCSDPALYRVLQKYDFHKQHLSLVESIGIGNSFRTTDDRVFTIISKRRTRYECVELSSGKKYLFPGIYEVLHE
jgi:hypothetical protein